MEECNDIIPIYLRYFLIISLKIIISNNTRAKNREDLRKEEERENTKRR